MNPVAAGLRERISRLEETSRRFARVIPVADAVDDWLPHHGLSAGCIHEIKGTHLASAIAFSAILAARLAGQQGHILYLAPDRSFHPLGLLPYGVPLERLIYISTRRAHDIAWAAMEALRCSQVSAMIALLSGLDLTESRKLQLSAEASGATGFFLGAAASAPIASPITRWSISPAPGKFARFDEPVWSLNLLYCRGGRPGHWTLTWQNQKLNVLPLQPARQIVREALAG